MRCTTWLFLLAAGAIAAPVPVGDFLADGTALRSWQVPGGKAGVLGAGQSAQVEVELPALGENEPQGDDDWRGVVSVDLFGTLDGGATEVELEAVDAAGGGVFAQASAAAEGGAPRAAWAVIASSEQRRRAARLAFDGDPGTHWRAAPRAAGRKAASWIGLELGETFVLPGVRYRPPAGEAAKGEAIGYRLEVRRPGGGWQNAASAEGKRGEALELRIAEPVAVEAFRLVMDAAGAGRPVSAGEITPIGLPLKPEAAAQPVARVWLEIPPQRFAKGAGKTLSLRVRNGQSAAVVVGPPQFARLHRVPSAKLFSRVNGGNGPDQLGVGLLGFSALTEHLQNVLTVIAVPEGSPAASSGLQAGEVILGVAGKPLPMNFIGPGPEWVRHSHEATIGRAIARALDAGERTLALTVLRDGKPAGLEIPLRREVPFATLDPADDPQAAALLGDQLAFLERTQRADGSWSGDIIRTTFSALALMATRDEKYRDRVARAVAWAMKKYPEPPTYGHLGFWAGSYAGILYSEWHLATGDDAVLPRLGALRDWVLTADFICRWDVRALGHGTRGIPYDRKALVAPACHLLVFEALAMRCGMESGIWEMILPYMELSWSDPKHGGHGALGYNPAHKDTREFWSRTGLFAMASHLRDERTDMRDAMIAFMAENPTWFRNSHAYGEPGGALGLLALNLVDPVAFAAVIGGYGWSFELGWDPGHGLRYTHPHMGSRHMGEEDLMNACYALVLQAPRRTLHLTGSSEKGYWAR